MRFVQGANGQQQESVALVVGGKALFCGLTSCQLTL
jgi:hypothetical protein